jgi:hypothetical protein
MLVDVLMLLKSLLNLEAVSILLFKTSILEVLVIF